MDLVELHFHLLPGVDDGPSSIEESLALARAAVLDGTRTMVTTPHVHAAHIVDPEVIAPLTTALSDELRRERIDLSVLPGGELSHTMVGRLSQRQLECIAQGPSGRRWVLLEAPAAGLGDDFEEAADELRERGFGIVIAHPERSDHSPETEAKIERELVLGSVLQITASAISGALREGARDVSVRLLRSAPVAVIASDAHGGDRMPTLQAALQALADYGEPSPDRFVAALPRGLLERGVAAGGFGAQPRRRNGYCGSTGDPETLCPSTRRCA
jgi:protein-tyrosine phosphatase